MVLQKARSILEQGLTLEMAGLEIASGPAKSQVNEKQFWGTRLQRTGETLAGMFHLYARELSTYSCLSRG